MPRSIQPETPHERTSIQPKKGADPTGAEELHFLADWVAVLSGSHCSFVWSAPPAAREGAHRTGAGEHVGTKGFEGHTGLSLLGPTRPTPVDARGLGKVRCVSASNFEHNPPPLPRGGILRLRSPSSRRRGRLGQMGTSVQVTPLSGAYGEGPLCYLLAVDGFRFLLDCGWTDLCDTSQLQPLAKYASSCARELSLSSIQLTLEGMVPAPDATLA